MATRDEEEALKEWAKTLLNMQAAALARAEEAGEVVKVDDDASKRSKKILEAVHSSARGLYAADAIDQMTMRHFDRLCLEPVKPLRPAEIRRIRESANVIHSGVCRHTGPMLFVQKWEIGQKRPTGTALKLLHLVQKKGLDAVA